MSSYVNFFLKIGKTFAPIGTYGRSTYIYEAFSDLPYGNARAITYSDLDRARDSLSDERMREDLQRSEERLRRIASFDNSVDEKLAAMAEEEDYMDSVRDEIEEIGWSRRFIGFLYDMLDEVNYSENSKFNPDDYLWAGIDCGDLFEVTDEEDENF